MNHNNIAYYRLPYADHYVRMVSHKAPLMLNTLEDIGGRDGFVIAPFRTSPHCPIILIEPDEIATVHITQTATAKAGDRQTEREVDGRYAEAFGKYHSAIREGRFRKLVLARCSRIDRADADMQLLYEEACRQYPRLMIMMFSTQQTGTWLISSPEILLESTKEGLHTIALAGTMPYEEGYAEWSEKNKAEQHVVEQYIEDTISTLCTSIVKDGPYTMRAGNLQHLRTDFRFQMSHPIGMLLAKLHPTPAVCGLPKQEAQQFIIDNEGMDRRYYSGFAGPVGRNGETHLYVSLRCAELFADHAVLYAGGGIMPDSQCEQEWQETESKMQTIGNVLK